MNRPIGMGWIDASAPQDQIETSGAYIPAQIKRGSVIQQAAEEICRLIEGRKLRPGDNLPPETTLAQLLGLSRNSVREAIRMLHGIGIVEKAAGRGAVVRTASTAGWGIVDEGTLIEAAEVANKVRILTMDKCVALAAERLSDADLEQLATDLTMLEAAAKVGDADGAKRAHDAFYDLVLAGARNPLLVAMFRQADSARLASLLTRSRKAYVAAEHLAHHRALLQALMRRDGAAATRAALRHYAAVGRLIKLVATQSAHDAEPAKVRPVKAPRPRFKRTAH